MNKGPVLFPHFALCLAIPKANVVVYTTWYYKQNGEYVHSFPVAADPPFSVSRAMPALIASEGCYYHREASRKCV